VIKMFELTAEDKIIRSKIQLQKENPFFAYLILHLNQKKNENIDTAGVDSKWNLHYNENFINKLDEKDVKFLLCHEVLHIALSHLLRKGNRDEKLWNISCDLIVNKIIELNFSDFEYSKIYEIGITEENLKEKFNIEIEKVEEKSAEEIYDILQNFVDKNKEFQSFVSKYGFDTHFNIDDLSEEQKQELEREYGKSFEQIKKDLENEIKKKLIEANNFAKMRGNVPLGMERIFDKILQSKLNWKEVLRKIIVDNIPYDFSWKYPSKKSLAVGIYLPSTQKDMRLEVVAVVDLSGSISDEEMNEFMSEIVNIAKSFRNVKITVLTHDTELQDKIVVEDRNIEKLMNIKLHGGGGTSHKWLPEFIKKEMPNARLIICFTDGYTEFFEEKEIYPRKVIWVLSKESVNERSIPFGIVIRMI